MGLGIALSKEKLPSLGSWQSSIFSFREVIKNWGPGSNLPGKVASLPCSVCLHSGSMSCHHSYTFTSAHLLRDAQITSWQRVSAKILHRHLTLLHAQSQWKGFVQHPALPRSSPLWPESLRRLSEVWLVLSLCHWTGLQWLQYPQHWAMTLSVTLHSENMTPLSVAINYLKGFTAMT